MRCFDQSKAVALGSLLFLNACASDAYLANSGHSAMRQRQFERAADLFENDAKKPSTNQLLFMLDQGAALFAGGFYEDAIKVFLRAEDVAAIKDYTSLSEEFGALATSSNIKGYRGEDFEKVLINVYLALSFAALGNVESAQVEARKINLILHRMISVGKRNYEESPFARYLSGILWEMDGSYNDAYIAYKKTYELDPEFPEIGKDLIAMAQRMRFNDEAQVWREKFPRAAARKLQRDEGEIIVIFERGLSPIKVPRHGHDSSLPRYISRYSPIAGAVLKIDNLAAAKPQTALDIEALSIRYLEDRIARMAAAKVIGAAVKGAVAAGVGKAADDEGLGWLVFHVLMASDRADLRSWRSLPASLQIARVPIKAGKYRVALDIVNDSGEVMAVNDFGEVEIKAGKKRFIIGR